MAKTLTLKNLPEALHARLSAAAKNHRRSLNNEAIVCLEAGLAAASVCLLPLIVPCSRLSLR